MRESLQQRGFSILEQPKERRRYPKRSEGWKMIRATVGIIRDGRALQAKG
jgi:hypothetical protein